MPVALQDRTLKQLNLSHIGVENTWLQAHESMYWINVNADIEKIMRNCPLG